MRALSRLAMPMLRALDPEQAHRLALLGLRSGLAGMGPPPDPRLAVRVMGLHFPSPIGLAAGFDKDAVALPALMRLGFGAIEAGTVTRLAQTGNPRPRLFRLPSDAALINRMGFNGGGITGFAARFNAAPPLVPLGANIAPNRGAPDPVEDFAVLATAVSPRADWVTLNVSSPNTPGLRDLQAPRRLEAILAAVRAAGPALRILVKLSPDSADGDLPDIVETCVESGAQGLVVSNTTLSRPSGLRDLAAHEAGGLSGRPLMARSTALLERVAALARGRLVLVGCGGITTGADVLEKLRAGASLVQLYTAFAYGGSALLDHLHAQLLSTMPPQAPVIAPGSTDTG